MSIKLLPSMINKNHGWTKMTNDDYNILSKLIEQFILDDNIKIINFDDVSQEYFVNVSADIIRSVLEKMGFEVDFDGKNGWQCDCWYTCTRDDITITLDATCFSNNISLYKGDK